jgi:Methyltransferase domain
VVGQRPQTFAEPVTAYERRTTHSLNPLARFSHRARISRALTLISYYLPTNGALLDFGCAQGELLRRVRVVRPNDRLYGLDPFQLRGEGYVRLSSLEECRRYSFDLITAFDVLEHLGEAATADFFDLIDGNLTPRGVALISVPNMLGPALVPKLLHGAFASGSAHHYSWREALDSVVLMNPPPRLPPNRAGTMRHKGYDWRVTRKRIEEEFQILSETFTPFSPLWWGINSQWFCVFRPKKRCPG